MNSTELGGCRVYRVDGETEQNDSLGWKKFKLTFRIITFLIRSKVFRYSCRRVHRCTDVGRRVCVVQYERSFCILSRRTPGERARNTRRNTANSVNRSDGGGYQVFTLASLSSSTTNTSINALRLYRALYFIRIKRCQLFVRGGNHCVVTVERHGLQTAVHNLMGSQVFGCRLQGRICFVSFAPISFFRCLPLTIPLSVFHAHARKSRLTVLGLFRFGYYYLFDGT